MDNATIRTIWITGSIGVVLIAAIIAGSVTFDSERSRVMMERLVSEHNANPIAARCAVYGAGATDSLDKLVCLKAGVGSKAIKELFSIKE